MSDDAGCASGVTIVGRVIFLSLLTAGCTADLPDRNSIDDLPLLEVSEAQRIGSVADPNVGFSRLYGADVDRDGNVYALEGMDFQIRVYGPDGTLLRRIGRRGGGPGEFEDPPRYGLKGDTLWAYDPASGRITYFDRGGQVQATGRTMGLRVAVRTGWGFVMPHTMGADGNLVGWFTRVSYSRDNPPPEVGEVAVPRVRFDVSGAVIDTVGWMPGAPPRMVPPPGYDRGRWGSVTVAGESYQVPDPPPELPQWLPTADGYIALDVPYAASAEPAAFTVTRITNAGDTVYHRVLTYRPQPYTDELLDSVAAQQPRAWRDGVEVTKQVDARALSAVRAKMSFPAYRQPVAYPWLANDESVWLRRAPDPGQPARWIVLDAAGVLRGEVELAAEARPLWSRGAELWAAVADESDVPWLVRYRIRD